MYAGSIFAALWLLWHRSPADLLLKEREQKAMVVMGRAARAARAARDSPQCQRSSGVQVKGSINGGTPSHHPFSIGIFSTNYPFWGTPHLWKPPGIPQDWW